MTIQAVDNASVLTQLKNMTTVVADTGNLAAIKRLKPVDATTNPSLITAAAKQPENKALLQHALMQATQKGFSEAEKIEYAIDWLTVAIGKQIIPFISGRVSTEVDARLSFDTTATIAKARELIALYKTIGVDSDSVLIKIAATWEGIAAAKILENEGIHCNLTLIFGLHQAAACADAGVTLISPFVGRILDWYKVKDAVDSYPIDKDPGVLSVKQIYAYFKQHNHSTQIMGASFRSTAQIIALAGCDLLTIAPNLLDELALIQQPLLCALSPNMLFPTQPRLEMTQTLFNTMHSSNAMANELLQSGIDGFIAARTDLFSILSTVESN